MCITFYKEQCSTYITYYISHGTIYFTYIKHYILHETMYFHMYYKIHFTRNNVFHRSLVSKLFKHLSANWYWGNFNEHWYNWTWFSQKKYPVKRYRKCNPDKFSKSYKFSPFFRIMKKVYMEFNVWNFWKFWIITIM